MEGNKKSRGTDKARGEKNFLMLWLYSDHIIKKFKYDLNFLRVYRRIGCAVAVAVVGTGCLVFAVGVQQRQRVGFQLCVQLHEQLR